jgi:hypothetical protein
VALCALVVALAAMVGRSEARSPDPACLSALPKSNNLEEKNRAWRSSELWAWRMICAGATADFAKNAEAWKGDPAKPPSPDAAEWNNRGRTIRSTFLETVLQAPVSDAIPRTGLRIIRAYFPGRVLLSDLQVDRVVWLDHSLFTEGLWLNRSEFLKLLSIDGSIFSDNVLANLAAFRLIHANDAVFQDLVIAESSALGTLSLEKSRIKGVLRIDRTSIGGSLFLRGVTFSAAPADWGKLERVQQIVFCQIANNLELAGSTLEALDLTSTSVGQELRLVGRQFGPVTWVGPNSKLALLNTTIGTLHDAPASWPKHISLGGFSLSKWGGYSQHSGDEFASRDSAWFADWIAKDDSHSMSAYSTIAALLKDVGEVGKANEVLYSQRIDDRARQGGVGWLLSMLSECTVGYGYRLERGFIGFLVLVLVAWPIFGTGTLAAGNQPRSWLVFSMDSMVPLASLDEEHKDIAFQGWRQYFLYFMKLMSAILVYFTIQYIGQQL